MNVNISKIKSTKGLTTKFNLQEQAQNIVFEGQEIRFVSPVLIKGEVINTGNLLAVFGDAQTEISLNCNRCLEEFTLPVKISFDAVYANDPNQENDDVRIFNGDEIVLDDLVIETILLELPLKYLCSEDCKGLCSQCGCNLNEVTCECDEPVDPRFGVLAELLKADKSKGV